MFSQLFYYLSIRDYLKEHLFNIKIYNKIFIVDEFNIEYFSKTQDIEVTLELSYISMLILRIEKNFKC
jgi:hypothetical protein